MEGVRRRSWSMSQSRTICHFRQMKILQVHNYYRYAGGEDHVVRAERDLLLRHGHEVIPFETSSAERSAALLLAQVVFRSHYSPQARRRFAAALEAHRPDLVHAHNLFPLLTPSIYDACRQAGIPVVQTLHNFRMFYPNGLLYHNGRVDMRTLGGSAWALTGENIYHGSRLLTAAMIRSIEWHRARDTWNRGVDRFIALTPFARDLFVNFGMDPQRISVKPNFISMEKNSRMAETQASAEDARSVSRPHNVQKQPNSFIPAEAAPDAYALFAGRVSPEKGLLPIVSKWDLSHPLIVAGVGPQLNRVRQETNGNVRFMGWIDQDELAGWMRRASALIIPSECFEMFPVTLLEAMSRGVPVVCYDLGAQADIVRRAECGILVPPGDSEGFVAAAGRLIQDAKARARLGENGRRACMADYSPEANYKMLMSIYSEALESKQG